MPQTLLALLGIVLASVLALHQSRNGAASERRAEAAEVQALAAEVAMERLARLEGLAFDQAVVAGRAQSPAQLTPFLAGRFVAVGPDPAGDDLDDADGESAEGAHDLRQRAGGGVGGVRLRTTVAVRYVRESDGETVATAPTRFKRATVTVAPVPADGAPPVTLTQLFSCGSYCAW